MGMGLAKPISSATKPVVGFVLDEDVGAGQLEVAHANAEARARALAKGLDRELRQRGAAARQRQHIVEVFRWSHAPSAPA
jgi:hypothetical protein